MKDYTRYRIAPDYGCHAVWDRDEGSYRNIEPRDLSVPEALAEALGEWSKVFDATLNAEDPVSSGFATESEVALFACWGRSLALWVAELLGEPIEYFDITEGSSVVVGSAE